MKGKRQIWWLFAGLRNSFILGNFWEYFVMEVTCIFWAAIFDQLSDSYRLRHSILFQTLTTPSFRGWFIKKKVDLALVEMDVIFLCEQRSLRVLKQSHVAFLHLKKRSEWCHNCGRMDKKCLESKKVSSTKGMPMFGPQNARSQMK